MSKKSVIVVLGMHRSGTSVITRGLQVLGVSLGNNLLPPAPDNEKGFWEDVDINALNISLLSALGYDWHSLTPILPEEINQAVLAEFQPRAMELLQSKLSSIYVFGLKDPRMAKVLPFWQSIFTLLNLNVFYIIACRHPASVADSLFKRNGFDLEKGYCLWQDYMLSSLAFTSQQKRLVVAYENLMADPAKEFQRISRCFDLIFDSTSDRFITYQNSFIKETLWHNRHSSSDFSLDHVALKTVNELFCLLQDLSEDRLGFDDPTVDITIHKLLQKSQETYPLLRYLRICDDRSSQLQDSLVKRDAQIAEINQLLGDRDLHIANLNQDLDNRIDQLAVLHKTVTDLDQTVLDRESQIDQMEQLLREQEQHLAESRQKVAWQEAQILDLKGAVTKAEVETDERQRQLDDLGQQLRSYENQITTLATQVERSESRIRSITESTTWRLLLPLRKIKAKLARIKAKLVSPGMGGQGAASQIVPQPPTHSLDALTPFGLLATSGLFDGVWYLAQYPDVAAAGIDPVEHYLEVGAREGRDPNPAFDSDWYLAQYPDVAASGMNPLGHYLHFGAIEGRDPNPAFDSDWYLAQYPDVAASEMSPLGHYLHFGAIEGRDPNPAFDSDWYLAQYPDVAASGMGPLEHYLHFGAAEERPPNPSACQAMGSLLGLDNEASTSQVEITQPQVWGISDINDAITAGLRFAQQFQFSLDDDEASQQGLWTAAVSHLSSRTPSLVIAPESPDVSIIIPVYGQLGVTLNCLDSLSQHQSHHSVEIIVLDDASPEVTQTRLMAEIPWVRYVRQEQNAGFTKNCNYGATLAKGHTLVFLNSDTRVVEGWLDELILTFKVFPNAGLVGSKLLNGDGSLQEAGGIFWNDGSAWNFGRGDDPNLPQYCYARRVDYCSGAAIAVPKNIWQEVGGFDDRYAPAYCEDADLAFQLRERGYDTIFQPLSQVVHYEGKTHGRDLSRGIKAYQIENGKKLFTRWQKQLKAHNTPGIDADQAKDRMAKRRVLVVEHCTPTPDQDAGSVLDFNIMMLLREMEFQVTFIPEDNFLYVPLYTQLLQRAGIEMLYAPYCTSLDHHLQGFGDRYDLILIFRWSVAAPHLEVVRKYCPNAKVLFYAHDLHYLRTAREAKLRGNAEKMALAEDIKVRELAVIQAVDASIVVSTAELDILKQELTAETIGTIHVWPLILEIQGTSTGYAQRQDIAFVGGYRHVPNIDAVHYFAQEVMPLLRQRLPGVRFLVVGSNPPDELRALAGDDIVITGFVENLPALLDTVRVAVAPLRFGAGIKGKIGTALAAGLPTVATSLAVEGMALTDGENILVADGAEDLANAIARLYQDESLWQRLSEAGIDFATQVWGGEAAWHRLNSILQTLGLGSERRTTPLVLYGSYRQPNSIHTGNGGQGTWGELKPVATVTTKADFEHAQAALANAEDDDVRASLVTTADTPDFTLEGFCVPCNQTVAFQVDMTCGGQQLGQQWRPNWRERLVCPRCHMSNRQRLIATLVQQKLRSMAESGATVYFMEQVTPIFQWALKTFPQHQIIGSEYLGYEYTGGAVIEGIRHEDVMALSFGDSSLDVIVSNDVFEHVPSPKAAFQECFRVLKPGGILLATIPFHDNQDTSVTRAQLDDDQVHYILPPMYHGNPISLEGSLVFTDFGWDMLDDMGVAGFTTINVEIYASKSYGHLGQGQIVFSLVKK